MPQVNADPSQIGTVAKFYTQLIASADEARKNFLKLLLTVYTPVTSGLFFLTVNLVLTSVYEKTLFLGVITTSVFIVLLSMAVFIVYFFTSEEIANKYINHFNKTGTHFDEALTGKKWHGKLIRLLTLAVIISLIVNVMCILGFIYLRII